MRTCLYCGEPIKFRHNDNGQNTPIHINGNRCPAPSNYEVAREPFTYLDSFVNPNARCPVCGDPVFFYQSRYGGRVFFDDLGWPWPKHPCTDNPAAQSRKVRPLRPTRSPLTIKNKHGAPLELYELDRLTEAGGEIQIRFAKVHFMRVPSPQTCRASISLEELEENDIKIQDIRDAPSFLVNKKNAERPVIEFICARRKEIVSIPMERI